MHPKVTLPDEAWATLILAAERDGVYLEGGILKILDPGTNDAYTTYLTSATAADKERRSNRLQVTKQVQKQNRELEQSKAEIEQQNAELLQAKDLIEKKSGQLQEALDAAEKARESAEGARRDAENDLDYMQKRTQFELMGRIVQVSLFVVVGVGTITTGMYALALFGPGTNASDTTLLANTWSNMFGILLTNSFSIIGTIMGVKYATEGRGSDNQQ
tara:strand:+ start:2029 stop:2679 length:651 start_codon:yes stop_codon:yes gene_type:complete